MPLTKVFWIKSKQPMKWQKPSEALAVFLKTSLKNTTCQSRKMFGCPAYFINNNMFTGAFRKDIFIRLSPEDKEKALEKYKKIKPFMPRTGIIMKEYVALPKTLYSQKKVFSELLKKSFKYTRSLPPRKTAELRQTDCCGRRSGADCQKKGYSLSLRHG